MGTRNAYRLSVDPKNNYVYWGDVGPDSDKDSLDTRGPKGYDELNQARKAGYFGWPLFIGKNYPYHAYDYYTGKSGPLLIRRNQLMIQKIIRYKRIASSFSAIYLVSLWHLTWFSTNGNRWKNCNGGPVYYSDLYPAKMVYLIIIMENFLSMNGWEILSG
jgi:Glucose/sorbosone dehydrogenases